MEKNNKVVIKIGSSTVLDDTGRLDSGVISGLCAQVSEIFKEGNKVVLVVSGAVAHGRSLLGIETSKVAAAAVGQVELVTEFKLKFDKHEIKLGQLLLQRRDLEKEGANQVNLIKDLWKRGCLVIVNENDAVELNGFGGNDYLAAKLTKILEAWQLVMCSVKKKSSFGVGGMTTKLKVAESLAIEGRRLVIVNGKETSVLTRLLINHE